MSSEELGKALYGLQGLSSSKSIFEETAIGIDSDEVQFLLSTMWDKIKIRKDGVTLKAAWQSLQGVARLRDPIAENIRQYMYQTIIQLGIPVSTQDNIQKSNANNNNNNNTKKQQKNTSTNPTTTSTTTTTDNNISLADTLDPIDIIKSVRALRLNNLLIPKWLAMKYIEVERENEISPIIPLRRMDKLVVQKFQFDHPKETNVKFNSLIDGFRLDMDFHEIKLNIELDGYRHYTSSRTNFDRTRDQFLTEKKGYEVYNSKFYYYFTYYYL